MWIGTRVVVFISRHAIQQFSHLGPALIDEDHVPPRDADILHEMAVGGAATTRGEAERERESIVGMPLDFDDREIVPLAIRSSDLDQRVFLVSDLG